MAVNRATVIKIIEVVLAVILVILHYQTSEEPAPVRSILTSGTYVGFAIIIIVTFVGHMTGNGLNKTLDLIYCVVGAILYILSAWFSYNNFTGWKFNESHANVGLAKAGLAVVQGVVLIVDAFFTFKAE